MLTVLLMVLLSPVQSYSVPTASMQPTLTIGDRFFANKMAWGIGPNTFRVPLPIPRRLFGQLPVRGEIAVFHNAHDGSDYFKRIIGLPGDTVAYRDGRLYINGTLIDRQPVGQAVDTNSFGESVPVTIYRETLPEGVAYTIQEIGDDEILDNTEDYVVPEGCYFMLGDNRDRSQDSRVLSAVGYVPALDLIGRPLTSADGSVATY